MTDRKKSQTQFSSWSPTDFLPRLEKRNVPGYGIILPPVEERTMQGEEDLRQVVREDVVGAGGVINFPKFCFIEPKQAGSFDLRSGRSFQHCSAAQVQQFNEQLLPRLTGQAFAKVPSPATDTVRIPTQPADISVFLTNGAQEQSYLEAPADIESLVQESLASPANALLETPSQEGVEKENSSAPSGEEGQDEGGTRPRTTTTFDAGGYERKRDNTLSHESNRNKDFVFNRTEEGGWRRNREDEEQTKQRREQGRQEAERYRRGRTRRSGGFRKPFVGVTTYLYGDKPVTSNWDEREIGNEDAIIKGTWQTGATSRGAGIKETVATGKGLAYNGNAHIEGSVARFDVQTTSDGPARGAASGSFLSYSAEADGNIVLGKGLAIDGRLGASVHLAEVGANGEVKITPRRAWHQMKCNVETTVKLPLVIVGLVSLPECEKEEGLDDGFGIVIGGRAGAQIGLGAEAGFKVDLGENKRIGVGGHAKATAVGGLEGGLYFGVDWSSKDEE